jgi:hypothetical protein
MYWDDFGLDWMLTILREGHPRWCITVRVPARSSCVDGPIHKTIEYKKDPV